MPEDMFDSTDIILLNISREQAEAAVRRWAELGPETVEAEVTRESVFQVAWGNRVRTWLLDKGLVRVGGVYVPVEEILQGKSRFKRAFRVQSAIINGHPSIFVDPKTRIMTPLNDVVIDEAEGKGEASTIRVRLLPWWQSGLLQGRTGKQAGDMSFPLGERDYPTPKYWRFKHGITFVRPEEEMLDVYVSGYERTLPYPRSCIFAEFGRGAALPTTLRKEPQRRVDECLGFISKYLTGLKFLGQETSLLGPSSVSDLGYSQHLFPPQDNFYVLVGGNTPVPVTHLHRALKSHGPYANRIDGEYIVIHSSDLEMSGALSAIEEVYSDLNLGKLNRIKGIGEDGFVETIGESVADYTSLITKLRPELAARKRRILAMIVLPDPYSSEIYFKSRDKFFERIFRLEPLPTQGIALDSIKEILDRDRSRYGICVNTASQCYVKLGGTGSAVWILRDPADTGIPGIQPGSSCYAYHDVSRRPKKKASATAYSAMTDSYGRYIATGAKPIGGEKLTPSVFYDILVEMLQKISLFIQQFRDVGEGRRFGFERLVFAKDGIIRHDEAEMMEQVILEGIKEERKEPIPELLKKIPILPDTLIIDLIGVNKSPVKRVFEKKDMYVNVPEGTAISYDESTGLLISAPSRIGTLQPIEISLMRHICLNRSDVPPPHISKLMEEYYRLTFLNWSSIFRQGKYALPQILTQNLGENISAGVMVPDDMVLL